jgi:heme-degrading monooxygenase HmoA
MPVPHPVDSGHDARVVLEHAVLNVPPGQASEFEQAFGVAKWVIAAAPGFVTLRLSRSLEQAGRYVLLVEWQTLEDHTAGFRGSARYAEWRRLLHRFYDPFPTVEHFEDLVTVP